ncbi:hypothetical protein GCM10025865_27250 [Paraoerskovia sediminicola]|uniref:Helix-turn-helix domain-containing protein n=1 Tax=Paraoerskovia sediminicola TaxID=1138587 RepID=A0ABM8G5V7_9CELL|nr:excisionase family DNA-binding protein [Paraoerskovia sediminicola]BDZ43426.1 hypothetical protein GCM10025865_27250 [Paraoerskovia sediminicola]
MIARSANAKHSKRDSKLPRYGTLEQGAELLGVSKYTVRRRISDGSITGYRVGRFVRVDLDELPELVETIPSVRFAK